MLLRIREFITGWLAAAIIVVLIIPFAFWGISYYFGGGGKVSAMEVNGTKISLQEFQRAYQNARQRYQAQTGNSVPVDQEAALKQSTVNGLIDRELLKEVNASLGVTISDESLTSYIKGIQEFQGANGFDDNVYRTLISRMGYTPARFEAAMRSDIATTQLQSAIMVSGFVTSSELTQIESLIKQKRDISYAILSSDPIKESTKVTDDDIKKYYDEHTSEFMAPEQVKIAYVELSQQQIANSIKVTDDELRNYYENNKAQYEIAGKRKFKDLFIAAGKDASPKEVAKAKAEIQAMYKLVKNGSSFKDAVAAVQKDKSQDIEVIDQDYVTKGIMEPEVDKVLFNQKVGDLSKPIKTADGFHIIRLEDVKGGTTSTFASAREQVEQDYREAQAEPKYADDADQLTNLAFTHPDNLDTISEKLGLKIHKTPFFSRQWQPNEFLRNPKIVKASFSDEVLQGGNNSEPIEVGQNRMVVLRVTDHKAAKKKPLAKVRDSIITKIKFERARDGTRAKGDKIISALKQTNGSDEDIAKKHGFVWQRVSGVERDSKKVDGAILRTAFRLGHPQAGHKIFGGESLASGDYAIIEVSAVQNGKPSDMTAAERKALKTNLVKATTTDSWIEFLNQLKSAAKIHVYKKNL